MSELVKDLKELKSGPSKCGFHFDPIEIPLYHAYSLKGILNFLKVGPPQIIRTAIFLIRNKFDKIKTKF